MTAASTLPAESQRIALLVHELLSDIDPARWRDNFESAMWERLHAAQEGMSRMAASMSTQADENMAHLRRRFAEMAEALREYAPRPTMPEQKAIREEWEAFRKRVLPVYENMAASLRAHQVKVPSLRPTNYARSIFHLSSALSAVIASEWLLPGRGSLIIAISLVTFSWTLEATRRMSSKWNDFLLDLPFFKPIVHEQERHHVNSATWFVTALLLLSLLDRPAITTVGLLVLGFADPVAGFVGRRWGTIKLVYGKSMQGTVAFFLTGLLVGFVGLMWLHPSIGWAASLVMAGVAALLGAVTELYSRTLDDNFSIPVIATLGALVGGLLMGLPLL